MSLIKFVSSKDGSSFLLKSKTLEQLREKGKAKFGYKISKILRFDDNTEIDDDEVLEFYLSTGKELCLLAMAQEEKHNKKIKVSRKDLKNPIFISADNLDQLRTICEREFGIELDKIIRQSDGTEIDDDDEVFQYLVENEKDLWLIAIEEEIPYQFENLVLDTLDDTIKKKVEYEKKENCDYNDSIEDEGESSEFVNEIRELQERLKGLKSNPTKKTEENIKTVQIEKKKKELLDQIALEEKKNKEREKKLNELETLSTTLQKQEEKKIELEKKYKEKLLRTEATKEASKTEILNCEIRLAELELKQKRIANVFKELEKAEHVDICFMVDCTGSMSSYINETKTVVFKIVDKLKKRFDNFNLRASFVGYRDHSDGEDRLSFFEFTEEIDNFKSFVASVKATGGADQCEDVFGGLEQVSKLNWKNMSRVLFHIADAPCHGSRFHLDCTDSYPKGDPRGLNITSLLKSIVEHDIIYYFAEINNSTVKMIDEFNNELIDLNGNKISVVKLSSVEGLTELVTKAIITTIGRSKTMSLHSMHRTKLKTINLDKTYLTFSNDKMENFKAILYKANFNGSIDEIKYKSIDLTKLDISISIAKKPFDKGALRYAYTALVNDERKCVVKNSASLDPEYNTMKFYKDMIESQVIARILAKKFLEIIKLDKGFRFLEVDLVHIVDLGLYYTIEDFIPGEFEKWSNNVDSINEDIYSCTLDAFCHWTYEITNEYLIVNDLQGFIVDKKDYILTDPAIQSPEGHDRFSTTNLGKMSVKKYFEKHRCNHICKHLKLKKHKYQKLSDRETSANVTVIKS